MTLLGFILAGFVGWGILFYHLDRPSIPAWKVRNTYRATSLLLLLLLLLLSYKLVVYHAELVQLIHICR